MIIHNFNICRIPVVPDKADPELIVNANAVLPLPVPVQCFEPIPRDRGEIAQFACLIDLNQLAPRDSFDGLKSPDELILKELIGIGIAKRTDHCFIV